MFKLFLLLIAIYITQSSAYSIGQELNEFELAIKKSKFTIDELLEEVGDKQTGSDEDINQLNEIKKFSETNSKLIKSVVLDLDYDFNPQQMIEYRGFRYEAHHVVTQDCYILEMHRIINPKNQTGNKPPVLLQHGLADSSTGFIINSIGGHLDDEDDRNLGFALAKRGYDVWLGNFRGNTYSMNHTNFSSKSSEFWKFTFDNHALQDLPAQIGYIQKLTNFDQIGYIGFSQGTLTMFELLSLKPEVSNAIKPYIAMAPVAYVSEIKSPVKYLSLNKQLMKVLLYKNRKFLAESKFQNIFSKTICREFPSFICKNLLFLTHGFSNQLNITRMPVYYNHFPAGTSFSNLIHYGLNVKNQRFEMLDYMSEDQNKECYNGKQKPPQIPLGNINITDLYLINSLGDLLADPEDVKKLKECLKVNYFSKTVELNEFRHIDFTLSSNVDHYVYDYIIDKLRSKTPSKSIPNKIRFKTFDKNTCIVPKKDSLCHLFLEPALENIIEKSNDLS